MLSHEAFNALAEMTIKGNRVKPGCLYNQLDYKQRQEVLDVLAGLNGRWIGGRLQEFIFPQDPSTAISATLATNDDIKQSVTGLDFFPTPVDLAKAMVNLGRLDELTATERILEPSAGTGRILDSLKLRLEAMYLPVQKMLIAVEVHNWFAALLRANGYQCYEQDFMDFSGNGQLFDRVFMNPPFNAYITHINHAWQLLTPGGRLVAIAPPGFTYRQDHTSREFLELVESYGKWFANEPNTFKSSGTAVNTVTLYLDKPKGATS